MPDASSTVLIIDDDSALRGSIARLLGSLGLDTRQFASITDFLVSDLPDGPTCLVLDVRLPLQLAADDHLATSIDAVDLKDRLGDVETDCRDCLHGSLL